MNKYIREGINIFLLVLGIFSAAFGIKGFLLPSKSVDGRFDADCGDDAF